ncbi:MAG: right-handed parallel beta-helix repeat-containing protein, partial [Novosphingobium sp.]|nr:right-handed parallel beta-helix repeat-containing protein [Novosphingobium sp.]
MKHIARLSLGLAALAAALPATLALAQQAAPYTVVETGRSYGRLQDAVEAIGGGAGTIRIAPGRYEQCAVQQAGEVAFLATQPGTAVFDGVTCEGKAALVLRG